MKRLLSIAEATAHEITPGDYGKKRKFCNVKKAGHRARALQPLGSPSSWLRLRSEGGAAGPNGPEQQAVEPVRDEVRTSSSAILLREIDRRAPGVKSIVQLNQPARACRQQFTD